MINILHIKHPVKDHPYDEIRLAMAKFRSEGKTIWVKYTCEHCKERVAGKANDWSPTQTCPNCGGQHDLAKSGGNYAVGEWQ